MASRFFDFVTTDNTSVSVNVTNIASMESGNILSGQSTTITLNIAKPNGVALSFITPLSWKLVTMEVRLIEGNIKS
jgi:hypothetical protein